MNRIVTHVQTCAIVAVLFCVPNAFAMKQFDALKIDNNPEAKNSSQNFLVGPATVLHEGRRGDSIGSSILLNNDVLAMAFNQGIKVWDLTTGKEKYSLNHGDWTGHNDSSPSKLADGSIVSVDRSIIKVWDSKDGSLKNDIKAVGDYPEAITHLLNINENTIVTSLYAWSPVIKVWNLGIKEGKLIQFMYGHNKHISDLLKITDKYIASASHDKTVKMWSVGTGRCMSNLLGHEHKVVKLVKISDTCIASGDSKGNVRIWDLYTGKSTRTLCGKEARINNLIIASNKIIVEYLDGKMQVWDWITGKLLNDLAGHAGIINDLIVANDNTLISCSNDRTIKVWDLNKGILVQSILIPKEEGYYRDVVKKIFITTIQNVPTLVAATEQGAIITCPCKLADNDEENII